MATLNPGAAIVAPMTRQYVTCSGVLGGTIDIGEPGHHLFAKTVLSSLAGNGVTGWSMVTSGNADIAFSGIVEDDTQGGAAVQFCELLTRAIDAAGGPSAIGGTHDWTGTTSQLLVESLHVEVVTLSDTDDELTGNSEILGGVSGTPLVEE